LHLFHDVLVIAFASSDLSFQTLPCSHSLIHPLHQHRLSTNNLSNPFCSIFNASSRHKPSLDQRKHCIHCEPVCAIINQIELRQLSLTINPRAVEDRAGSEVD